jgi:DNA-binding NarL/FixJ family response regulator
MTWESRRNTKDDHVQFALGERNPDPPPRCHQPSARCGGRPTAAPRRLPLALLASDPVTGDGAKAYLRQAGSLAVLPADRSSEAEAVLALASNVTGDLLTSIERLVKEASGAAPPVVLVADSISRSHLVRAISHGLISFLPRAETGMERAVQAVLAAREGRADLPQSMVKALIEQVRSTDGTRAGKDTGPAGLSHREIDVLSLIAEGLSTSEVAQQLNYSEKTIKNILHSMTVRLGLRNRAHAVAYAVRAGVV